jgi:hypothetical protein
MPSMPRSNKKAERIAYDILGVPANIRVIKTKKQKDLDKQIEYQKTDRIK